MVLFGCHRKATTGAAPEPQEPVQQTVQAPAQSTKTANPEDEQEQEDRAPERSPMNSWIQGFVVEVMPIEPDPMKSEPCAQHACVAMIEVQQITQQGMNYHHQFGDGELMKVYFQYTMAPSSQVFPDISPALPGLNSGDSFEAELFENPDSDTPYAVKLYTKN